MYFLLVFACNCATVSGGFGRRDVNLTQGAPGESRRGTNNAQYSTEELISLKGTTRTGAEQETAELNETGTRCEWV